MRAHVVSLLLAAAAIAPSSTAGISEPATGVDLTGTWTLNRQLSSPAGSAPGEPDAGPGPRGGGRGPGGRGPGMGGGLGGGLGGRGGGRGGPGTRMPSEEDMKRQRALMQEILEPAVRFTIARSDTVATFVFPDGRTRSYAADDRKEQHQLTAGTVETRTKWEKGALVIRTKLSDRLAVTQHYGKRADSSRLVVTTKLDGGRRDRPGIEHVYERADAER